MIDPLTLARTIVFLIIIGVVAWAIFEARS